MIIKKPQPLKNYKIIKDVVVSNKGKTYLIITIQFNLLAFSYDERYQEKLISGRTEVILIDKIGSETPKTVECNGNKYYARWVFKPANHAQAVELAKNDLLAPCNENFDYSLIAEN